MTTAQDRIKQAVERIVKRWQDAGALEVPGELAFDGSRLGFIDGGYRHETGAQRQQLPDWITQDNDGQWQTLIVLDAPHKRD